MELTTILGLVFACSVIGVGFIIAHIEFTMLLNAEMLVVIFGGTVATVTQAFPGRQLKEVPKLFKVLFTVPKSISKVDIVTSFTEFSSEARKNGMLALEPKLEEIQDPFMKKAVGLVIDGQGDQDFIRGILEDEIGAMEERHGKGATVFVQAGTYAPTLGVMGAVMGLIHAMTMLDDTEKLAEAIAAAFISTLMGIFTGYAIWHPFGNKLKVKSAFEVEQKMLIVEGAVALREGLAPKIVQQKLTTFLSPKEQAKLEGASGAKGDE